MKPANATKLKSISIVLIFFFVAACTSKKTDINVISRAYVDILIAKESFPQGSDSLKALTNRTFEKYKVTGEEYYSALEGFKADQKKWDEFFKLSRKYLDSLKVENKLN